MHDSALQFPQPLQLPTLYTSGRKRSVAEWAVAVLRGSASPAAPREGVWTPRRKRSVAAHDRAEDAEDAGDTEDAEECYRRTGNGRDAGSSSANFHGAAPSRVSGMLASRARTIDIGIAPPCSTPS